MAEQGVEIEAFGGLETLARWQGATEQKLIDQSGHLLSHDERLGQHAEQIGDIKENIAAIRGSVRMWAAIGAIVGSGAVNFLLSHIH